MKSGENKVINQAAKVLNFKSAKKSNNNLNATITNLPSTAQEFLKDYINLLAIEETIKNKTNFYYEEKSETLSTEKSNEESQGELVVDLANYVELTKDHLELLKKLDEAPLDATPLSFLSPTETFVKYVNEDYETINQNNDLKNQSAVTPEDPNDVDEEIDISSSEQTQVSQISTAKNKKLKITYRKCTVLSEELRKAISKYQNKLDKQFPVILELIENNDVELQKFIKNLRSYLNKDSNSPKVLNEPKHRDSGINKEELFSDTMTAADTAQQTTERLPLPTGILSGNTTNTPEEGGESPVAEHAEGFASVGHAILQAFAILFGTIQSLLFFYEAYKAKYAAHGVTALMLAVVSLSVSFVAALSLFSVGALATAAAIAVTAILIPAVVTGVYFVSFIKDAVLYAKAQQAENKAYSEFMKAKEKLESYKNILSNNELNPNEMKDPKHLFNNDENSKIFLEELNNYQRTKQAWEQAKENKAEHRNKAFKSFGLFCGMALLSLSIFIPGAPLVLATVGIVIVLAIVTVSLIKFLGSKIYNSWNNHKKNPTEQQSIANENQNDKKNDKNPRGLTQSVQGQLINQHTTIKTKNHKAHNYSHTQSNHPSTNQVEHYDPHSYSFLNGKNGRYSNTPPRETRPIRSKQNKEQLVRENPKPSRKFGQG